MDHVTLAITVAEQCHRLAFPASTSPVRILRTGEEVVNESHSVIVTLAGSPGRSIRTRCIADKRYGWRQGKCYVTAQGVTSCYYFSVDGEGVSVITGKTATERKMLIFTIDLLIQQLGQSERDIAHKLRMMGHRETVGGLKRCITKLSALTIVSIEMLDGAPILSGWADDIELPQLRLKGAAATFVQRRQATISPR